MSASGGIFARDLLHHYVVDLGEKLTNLILLFAEFNEGLGCGDLTVKSLKSALNGLDNECVRLGLCIFLSEKLLLYGVLADLILKRLVCNISCLCLLI